MKASKGLKRDLEVLLQRTKELRALEKKWKYTRVNPRCIRMTTNEKCDFIAIYIQHDHRRRNKYRYLALIKGGKK